MSKVDKLNKVNKIGKVKCGQIRRGVKHPQVDNYIKITASSCGPAQWKNLSPFLLGPVTINDRNLNDDYFWTNCNYRKMNECLIFENYWQGSKIYDIDLDVNGEILDSFFKRREMLFTSDKPKRRAVPKSKGFVVCGFYNGKIMDYIESRNKIYCPIYADLIRDSEELKQLKEMLELGQKLLIVGPDGRDIPITKQSMKRAIMDPTHIFGHELVICCLLNGWEPWND